MPQPADLLVDGSDTFVFGQNSFSSPGKLDNGQFVQGQNIMIRGGLAQTRPGSKTCYTLPQGNLQGLTLFQPSSGPEQLVAVVDGIVYVSPYPFIEYRRLPGVQFSKISKYVTWATCVKSTGYTLDGIQEFLDNPYTVLIIQDGLTRARILGRN